MISICAAWIFVKNASKGKSCLIAASKYEIAQLLASCLLALIRLGSVRSNSQVPDVLTVVVLSQVDLSLSEVLPSCNNKMGEFGLAILSAVDQTIVTHDAKTIMTFLVVISSPVFELHLCQLEICTYTFSTEVHPA